MLDLTTPTEPTIEQLGEQMSTVLDLSSKGLKKVPKLDGVQHIKEIILDENLLQKIDNIDSFLKIEKVCLVSFILILLKIIFIFKTFVNFTHLIHSNSLCE